MLSPATKPNVDTDLATRSPTVHESGCGVFTDFFPLNLGLQFNSNEPEDRRPAVNLTLAYNTVDPHSTRFDEPLGSNWISKHNDENGNLERIGPNSEQTSRFLDRDAVLLFTEKPAFEINSPAERDMTSTQLSASAANSLGSSSFKQNSSIAHFGFPSPGV
ncbi:hypothetical protein C8F04DRAFT_1195123 [Mycena alexandri]|uniref:Uncharacterized protein n=1 Tax=Mycena alexandri TaxID=1745969 RepID=A0AAD6S616_9AGAR|nr:hypothetical protein C8F04DRAFT_1195123 [Mycena alexandri]